VKHLLCLQKGRRLSTSEITLNDRGGRNESNVIVCSAIATCGERKKREQGEKERLIQGQLIGRLKIGKTKKTADRTRSDVEVNRYVG